MNLDLWTAVDRYVNDRVVFEDDALRAATDAASRAGLPAISVTSTTRIRTRASSACAACTSAYRVTNV